MTKMLFQVCCICLDSTQPLKKLSDEDEYKVQLVTKLNDVAPEQKWLKVFSICFKCDIQLYNAYSFQKLCCRNDYLRIEFSQQQSEQIILASNNLYSKEDLSSETFSVKEEDIYENGYEEEKIDIISQPLIKEIKNEIFICFHCNKKFKSKQSLEHHLKNHHNNVCRQCSKVFIFKKHLRIHRKSDHPNNNSKSTKFQCDVCGEYFSLLKSILAHCSSMHSMNPKDVKPYCCTKCKNKFSSSTLLIQHIKYHDGDRKYVCSICGKSFITKRDLSGHEKLHENQRKYGCDKCSKSFNTSQNLKTHIYVVHTDPSEWKYACPICLKKFAMKANFNEHVKRHQGSKDFICHICKKTFVSNHEVKKHVKLHSNIAPYKCTQCQKTYRDKRSLDLHLSRTHGIGIVKLRVRVKKFVCHICPSQFFDNHKLQRHIRTHTGEKPYACHGCDKRFVDKSYLSYHLKSVHNVSNSVKCEN